MAASPESRTGHLFELDVEPTYAPPAPRRKPSPPVPWVGDMRRRTSGHRVVELRSDGYHASAHGRELGVFATLIEAVISAEAE